MYEKIKILFLNLFSSKNEYQDAKNKTVLILRKMLCTDLPG